MASNLLIEEPPLQVLPSLAEAVGLNEAIFLQQLHYWLRRTQRVREGRKCIFNSYSDWHRQFPFWSTRTIRRIVKSCREQGLVVTERSSGGKTYYSIDYDSLARLSRDGGRPGRRGGQSDQSQIQKNTAETTESPSSSSSDETQLTSSPDDGDEDEAQVNLEFLGSDRSVYEPEVVQKIQRYRLLSPDVPARNWIALYRDVLEGHKNVGVPRSWLSESLKRYGPVRLTAALVITGSCDVSAPIKYASTVLENFPSGEDEVSCQGVELRMPEYRARLHAAKHDLTLEEMFEKDETSPSTWIIRSKYQEVSQ